MMLHALARAIGWTWAAFWWLFVIAALVMLCLFVGIKNFSWLDARLLWYDVTRH